MQRLSTTSSKILINPSFRSFLASELRQTSFTFQRSHFSTEVQPSTSGGGGGKRSTPKKGEKKPKAAEDYVTPEGLMAFYRRPVQPLFPTLVDIPTNGDDNLTPFQRGIHALNSGSSEPNPTIKEKWDPNQQRNTTFEDVMRKEDEELERLEQIVRECRENQKKLTPTEFRKFASDALETEDDEVLTKLQALYDASGKKNAKGKLERRKLIFGAVSQSKDFAQFENDQETQGLLQQMVSDFQGHLRSAATMAPELVAIRTFMKGLTPPLDHALKKVNRYNAFRIRAAAKRRALEGERKEKKKKEKLEVEIGVAPNALRYVDKTHPHRLELEEFAYAIGFNKSWTEADKKKLVEEYSQLLRTPIPDTPEFKEIIYVNSEYRNRSEEVRRAQFEEMYNEEVQNLEGGEREGEED